MKKLLSKNLIPLLLPFAVWGCSVLTNLAHGNLQGAAVEGGKAVASGVKRTVEAYANNKDEVNLSQEYYVGRGTAANIFAKYKRVHSKDLEDYVRRVGETVAAAASGSGAKGLDGAAFGVANHTQVQVLDLLLAVNARSANGLLFDMTADGDTNDTNETLYREMANDVFESINDAGRF